jgi:hypothetical protein
VTIHLEFFLRNLYQMFINIVERPLLSCFQLEFVRFVENIIYLQNTTVDLNSKNLYYFVSDYNDCCLIGIIDYWLHNLFFTNFINNGINWCAHQHIIIHAYYYKTMHLNSYINILASIVVITAVATMNIKFINLKTKKHENLVMMIVSPKREVELQNFLVQIVHRDLSVLVLGHLRLHTSCFRRAFKHW